MKISKRFVTRARPALKKFERVLAEARARDVNESDTTVILTDFLAEVLGYDKYAEMTSEFMIRSTFCDLAIKIDGKLHFLIEVKSIGTALRDTHLKQAVDYAANQGCDWVILTNGVTWQAHRVKFEKPVDNELVFEVDLLDPEATPSQVLQHLYLISREAQSLTAIEEYHARREATSPYVLAQLLLEPKVLGHLRRRLRLQAKGLKVTEVELHAHLTGEVLKRELVEGDRATAAERLVRRQSRKAARAKADAAPAAISSTTIRQDPT
ncbi:MAG: type I restriction enzyme HsdR N-terminal domain-containing protein [Gemmatimonadaceae bacterium]